MQLVMIPKVIYTAYMWFGKGRFPGPEILNERKRTSGRVKNWGLWSGHKRSKAYSK